MADWFYKSMGSEVGPISNKEMLAKVRAGEITPETEVRKNDSRWYLARAVGGLFEQAQKGAGQQVCPYCSSIVLSPPAKCGSCDRWVTTAVKQEKEKVAEEQQPKHSSISDALSSPGEDYNADEGLAGYFLMTFAITFVIVLGLGIFMIVGRRWEPVFWWVLGTMTVVMIVAMWIGLWSRKRAVKSRS